MLTLHSFKKLQGTVVHFLISYVCKLKNPQCARILEHLVLTLLAPGIFTYRFGTYRLRHTVSMFMFLFYRWGKMIMCNLSRAWSRAWHMSVSEREKEEIWSRCRARVAPPPSATAAAHETPPATVKKFSPDPNERFLKMSWGPGLGPGSTGRSHLYRKL